MKIDLKGNTSQATTTGKNLLKNTNVNSGDNNYWANYSTYDKETGTLTRSTTSTTENYIAHRFNLKNNTKYTISCLAKRNDYVSSFEIYAYNSTVSKAYHTMCPLTTGFKKVSFTFTTDSSTNFTNSTIRFDNNGSTQSGTEAILTIKDVMLVEGEDTEFEPYTNGASPNPDYPQDIRVVSGDNSINVTGKNLFTLKNINNSTVVYGVERTINNSELKLNGTSSKAGPIMGRQTTGIILPSGTYSVLVQKKSGTVTSNDKQTAFYFRKPNGTEITSFLLNNYWGNYSFKTTFVLSEATELYVELYCNGAGYTLDNLELQFHIESGYNLTPTYEPYQGNTYPVNLPVENLINYVDNLQTSYRGLTSAINADGSITTTGIPQYNYVSIISYDITSSLENGATYTLWQQEAQNLVLYLQINIVNRSTGTITYVSLNNSTSRTFIADTINNTYTLNLQTGTTTNWGSSSKTITNYYQLEKGSKANSYTPYGTTPIELCKIGNYQDEIKKSSGKNLFIPTLKVDDTNISTIRCSVSLSGDEYTFSATGSDCYFGNVVGTGNAYNKVLGTLYDVEGLTNIVFKPTNSSFDKNYACYYNNNKVSIGYAQINNSTGLITLPTGTKYVNFRIGINNSVSGTSYSSKFQLEIGNQATSFEPYGTGWYVKKGIGKIVLNGSETFDGSDGTRWNYTPTLLPKLGSATSPNAMSNYYTSKFSVDNNSIYVSGVFQYISIMENRFSNVSAFKTWLSTHNTIVYYVLATPTYTEITDSTLISQLNALAKSYASQTNISQESNDLASLLNATALEEM